MSSSPFRIAQRLDRIRREILAADGELAAVETKVGAKMRSLDLAEAHRRLSQTESDLAYVQGLLRPSRG